MSAEGPRRSRRLLTKPKYPNKSRCRVNKSPFSSKSSSGEDEVIYLGPKLPVFIDLTSKTPRKPQAEERISLSPRKNKRRSENEDFVLSVSLEQCDDLPDQPQKSNNASKLLERTKTEPVFKEPSRTPHKSKSKSSEERLVTPPKQRKIEDNENVPITPPTTPTVLLERLSLIGSGEKTNRKKLFQETDLYANARRALHSTCPVTMPGRDKELKELREFIVKHLTEGTSGSLYISGPPGTGKTASLNLILEDEKLRREMSEVYVNCTSIKSSGSIFARIAKDLGAKAIGKSERDYVDAIEKFLQKRQKTTLLVLDEIDQLESKKQSVLYTIFEWPAAPNSKLILIGIANALDLTDRTLPRLQARCELKPELMHFSPYTKQQIVEIFTNRLETAGVLDIFSPVALQMLAGKVAAVSGDVRRALDIGRRVIEMIDKRKKDDVLKSVENLAEELDEEAKPKKIQSVDLRQVVSVLNTVYGTTQNLDEEVDDAFPLQQKIVVCSLLLILKKAKNKDVTVGRLHEVYRRVCLKRNIQVVDQGEFVGVCSLIETRGIIKIIKKKDPRMSKVSLVWDEEEVANALKDKQLMSMILQDDNCLGKM